MGTFLIGRWIEDILEEIFDNIGDSNQHDFVRFIFASNHDVAIEKVILYAISPIFNDCFDQDNVILVTDFSKDVGNLFKNILYRGQSKENINSKVFEDLQILLNILAININLEKIYNSESPESYDSIEEIVTEIPQMSPKNIILPLTSKMKPLSKAELIYHCTVEGCTSHFFTHVGLRKHVENVHEEFAFVCNICQKRFRYQSTLKDHMNLHSELKSYLCDICGKAFKTQDICSSHRQSHGARRFNCEYCGDSFKQRNVLYQHKLKHLSKRFKCDICSKDFSTKQNLENHGRVHSGVTPYACQLCQMKFKRVHHFKRHLTTLIHLNKIKEAKKSKLTFPSDLDPGEEVTKAMTENSSCNICKDELFTFKSNYHFYKHIKSRAHMEKILQLSEEGKSVAANLLPPNLFDQNE